jgi:hypothetical protein
MNDHERDLNLPQDGHFNPATQMQRVSQRPGFIPLKTGDAIPDELRAALNVEPFVRELRQSINQINQGVLPCISISKLTV